MRTLFITSLTPFVTRNILLTDVLGSLKKQNDLRIIIFCPDFKADYFKKNCASDRVVIETIKPQASSFQDTVFKYLGGSLLNNRSRYIHQRRELLRDRNYLRFLVSRLFSVISSPLVVKWLVRFLDKKTISGEKFQKYFDQYKPDLVFCPDVFHDDDVHCLAEAQKRGIKTIGMVRSWDNITNKGLFRVKPDLLLVNNEIIKGEAVKYEDVNPGKITVVGMPQFDYYLKESRTPREEFFQRIKLDPKQRLVMFSPHGIRFHDTDWQIMQILKDARINGEIPENIQILVRFPPIDDVPLGDFIPDEHFFIDRPAKSFEGGLYRDQELDRAAMIHLADSLYYSELIVTYNSSLIIDAAVFNKPSIGIAFDGWEKKPDIYQSVARFMEYDHTQHLLKTGGLWVVRSKEELIKAINTYLKDPNYNLIGRQRIAETQSWKLDGNSGKRIAEAIIKNI